VYSELSKDRRLSFWVHGLKTFGRSPAFLQQYQIVGKSRCWVDPHTAIVFGSLALGNSTSVPLTVAGSGPYFERQRLAETAFEDAISVLLQIYTLI